MKKKLFVAIMLIAVAVVSFGVLSASAEMEGIYTYSVSEGEVIITDCYTSASGAIEIPDTLGGYPVTSIGGYAFNG